MNFSLLNRLFVLILAFQLPSLLVSEARAAAPQTQNHDSRGNVVRSVLISPTATLEQEKAGFFSAFSKAYETFSPEVFKADDKVQFLTLAFQEEIEDQGKKGVYQVRLEDEKGQLLAYFSLDNVDERRAVDLKYGEEYKDFPPNSCCIRQLYVLPEAQRRGIGALIIRKLITHYVPSAKHFYVAISRINEVARRFYVQQDFNETFVVLHNLPKDRYMSLEKHVEAVKKTPRKFSKSSHESSHESSQVKKDFKEIAEGTPKEPKE